MSDINDKKTCQQCKNHFEKKLPKCEKCMQIRYCSVECQSIDWKYGNHKALCRQITSVQQAQSQAQQAQAQQAQAQQAQAQQAQAQYLQAQYLHAQQVYAQQMHAITSSTIRPIERINPTIFCYACDYLSRGHTISNIYHTCRIFV